MQQPALMYWFTDPDAADGFLGISIGKTGVMYGQCNAFSVFFQKLFIVVLETSVSSVAPTTTDPGIQ